MIEGYALSPQQRQFWFHQDNNCGIAQLVVSMSGSVDREYLDAALNTVVAKHEVLRTRFEKLPGLDVPLQVIGDVDIFWEKDVDLTELIGVDKEKAIANKINAARLASSCSTKSNARIHITLIQIDKDIRLLVINLQPHQVDLYSLDKFIAEIALAYTALVTGNNVLFGDDAIQYIDISEWENELLGSREAENGKRYWQDMNFLPLINESLPIEKIKNSSTSPEYKLLKGELNGSLLSRMESAADNVNANIPGLCLALWQILLYRLGKRAEHLVGLMFNGRADDEAKSVIGILEKFLPHKISINDDLLINELVSQNTGIISKSDVWQECFSWDDFSELSEAHKRFFPYCFESQNEKIEFNAGDALISVYSKNICYDRFVIKLSCSYDKDKKYLSIDFHYDANAVVSAMVENLSAQFNCLLLDVLRDINTPIGKLNILPDDQRHAILNDFNNTKFDYVVDRSIHELVEAQVERTPNAIAVEFKGTKISYAELNAKANRLARELINSGAGPEQKIGVFLERSLDVIVSILAISKSGAVYLPLDISYPQDRIDYIIEDSKAHLIISYSHLAERIARNNIHLLCLDDIDLSGHSDSNCNLAINSGYSAYIIYTSGSTGLPKGTLIPHTSLVNHCLGVKQTYELTSDDRVLLFAPFSFDPSLEQCLPALIAGAVVVIKEEAVWDAANVAHNIYNMQLSVVNFPTSYWHLLVTSWSGLKSELDLGPLRLMIVGGDRILPETVNRWLQLNFNNVRLLNAYGPTEATVTATIAEMNNLDWLGYADVPIGKPLPNRKIYVLDEYQVPVPVGCVGELYIGGASLASGYFNRASLTQEKFVTDPFSDYKARMYKTGDRAFFSQEGSLYFLGRIDDQVKVRGYRVELGEIEQLISKRDDIQEVAVIAKKIGDQDDKQLLAFYVAKEAKNLSTSLREYLQGKLPNYMLPSSYTRLESFPLLPSGKLNRKALENINVETAEKASFKAPTTPAEKKIVSLLGDLLGLQTIGVDDNFLQLGGHSLMAMRLTASIRQEFSVDLSLKDIYQSENIATMAGIVASLQAAQSSNIPPLSVVSREEPLPLSYSQQRLWLLDEMGFGMQYHMPGALKIRGNLNESALQKTIDYVVSRHESLRTKFQKNGDKVTQLIDDNARILIEKIKLASTINNDWINAVRQWAERPFQLTTAPLMRLTLLQIDPDTQVLGICMHHIISDGASVSILLREISQAYARFAQDKVPTMDALEIQYADYANWQRKNLPVSKLDNELVYWRKHLEGYENFSLITDFPRPARFTGEGSLVKSRIARKDVERLKSFCQDKKITFYSLLMSATYYLLSCYARQTDFCIGMPVAGRKHKEVENVIGCFVNTLAIKINSDLQAISVSQFIVEVHNSILQAQDHQDLPFEILVENLVTERDLSRNPVFQVLLNYVKSEEKIELGNNYIEIVDIDYAAAKCDLAFDFTEDTNGAVELLVTYSDDLYRKATIERLCAHLFEVLNNILTAPEQPLNLVEIQSNTEKNILLQEWSTAKDISTGRKCFHNLFEIQASLTPNTSAVIIDGKSISYRQLNERSNQLAHYLIAQGVKPDMVVGLYIERSFEMIIGMLGIAKAGGAYVPLDPTYPEERLRHMVSDSGINVVLSQSSLAATFICTEYDAVCLDVSEFQTVLNSYSSANPQAITDLHNNLAYVLYTSGSTGLPKGVMIEHEALATFLLGARGYLSLDDQTRWLAVTTFAFDIAGLEIFGPLVSGGCIYLCTGDQSRDGQQLASLLVQGDINIMQATPASWQLLLDYGWQGNSNMDILCGGEVLPPSLANQLRPLCKRLINCYGPTEATIWSHMAEVDGLDGAASLKGLLPGYRQYVVSADGANHSVPIGMPGELLLGGQGLARGYLHQPELTTEKFLNNMFAGKAGERLYKTGDLVRWLDDGSLEFLGRIDQQIKIRGFRIELGEIESQLARLSEVRDVVVIALKDEKGDQQLVAYVVLKEDIASDLAGNKNPNVTAIKHVYINRFIENLSYFLPRYMVPERYVFLEKIPLTPNGKINRKALPGLGQLENHKQTYSAPRNALETKLCALWQEVLRVDQVGIDHSFFDLGGHSLLASRLVSRIREELKFEIPLRALFEAPTVKTFANILVNHTNELVLSPIKPIDRAQTLSLSYAQQRMWFIDQFGKGSVQYNMPVAFNLTGDLAIDILEKVLASIIERHEVLRTGFITGAREVAVHIHNTFELPLTACDLSTLNSTEQSQAVNDILARESTKAFDLSHDTLIRMHIIKLSANEHTVILTMHHIASDAWSLEILLSEFNKLYNAYKKGEANPLEEQFVQYVDFAHWQKDWLSGDTLKQHLNYWKNQLQGIPQVHNLQLDKPRPIEQNFTGRKYRVQIDSLVTQQINQFCKQQGVTLFMFLQTAFSVMLSRYSNEVDIVMGTPIAGRLHKNVEQMVGFFANTVVMRSDLSGNPEFTSLLQRNKQMILDTYTHQHIPFEMLVDVLNPERSMRYSPIFQILLVVQNNIQESLALADLSSTQLELEDTLTKFDIELNAIETVDGLSLSWHYNTSLFYGETIERMAQSFSVLLSSVLGDPAQSIQRLSLLTENEKSQQSSSAHHKYVELPCIHALFEEQVVRHSNKCAVVYESAEMSYAELNQRSNQLAHYLIELGVTPESLIGLCVERSLEMMVGVLGILKAGAAYIPLDPAYPLDRLEYVLEDSGAQLIVIQKHLQQGIPAFTKQGVICLDDINTQNKLKDYPSTNPLLDLSSKNLMYVIYTSGSTGKPKGVLVEHGNVARLFKSSDKHFNFTEHDTWTLFHSFAFDFSVWEMWGALLYGGKLVIVPRAIAQDSKRFASLLLTEKITVLSQIPTAFYSLVRAMESDNTRHHLKYIVFGGEALDYNQLKPWYALFGEGQTQLVNMYGITETTVHVTYKAIRAGDVDNWTSAIGHALDDLSVAVCDQYQQLVPMGVAGELLVGGGGVTRGYLNRPELTAEKFINDPFSENSSQKFYRTGDLVRQTPDGGLQYLGRIDNQEKIRGFRMELGEIEYHLSNVPGVKEVAVLARKDSGNEKILVGYLVQDESMRLEQNLPEQRNSRIATIIASMKKSLPEYMVPLVYVFLDSMPLTSSGKVDRKALPEITEEHLHKNEYVAPRNEIEQKLCRIWQDHLHLSQVGINDNYFSLGGDSIRALNIVALAEDEGIPLSVADIFRCPTISELSQRIQESSNEEMGDAELAKLLEEIENFSDEEVAARLGDLA